ncbi:MAG: NINE protein [Bacteroidota bacterium]
MKDKTTAGVLALVFGWLGLHRFYLGQPLLGILYIMLIWTSIPFFLMVIDGIILLTQDDDLFNAKYNNRQFRPGYSASHRPRNNNNYQQQRDRERERTRQRQKERQQYREQQRQNQKNRSRAPKTNPFKESAIRKYKNYDFEGAITDFHKSLKMQPNDPVTHFNVACAYSLTEQVEKGYHHLEQAVEQGYNQFDKIKSDGDLAYLRIQDEWETFVKNGYRTKAKAPASKQIEAPKAKPIDDVIMKIEKLGELKDKGYLSEEEFQARKSKLLDNLD